MTVLVSSDAYQLAGFEQNSFILVGLVQGWPRVFDQASTCPREFRNFRYYVCSVAA